MVSVTSARPSAGRPDVPAKTTSSILPPRSGLTPCWPMTHENASTTLDLPEPFGPTTQVIAGSKRSVVAEAKDLNPRSVRVFRYTACAPHQPVLVDSLRRAPPNPTVRHAGYELSADRLGRFRFRPLCPLAGRRACERIPPTAPRLPQPSAVSRARGACSGQRGFAVVEQNLVANPRGKHVVHFLKPG